MELSARMTRRRERLLIAMDRLVGRINVLNAEKRILGVFKYPQTAEKLARLNEKRNEYGQSLDNIEKFGVERAPNGLPDSVNIGAPTGGSG